MKNKCIYDKIFDKTCEVCGRIIKKDVYDQGECMYCGWFNHFMNEENPNKVLFPNLISLNKARKLYKEGKPFKPNLDEFIEALYCYSEVEFEYNGTCYAVELIGYEKEKREISLYNSTTKEQIIFKTREDFKNNSKVEDRLLKDIWDKVENPKYM